MGVVKSIAMTYSDREYLLYYLERSDYPNLEKLLQKRPELINVKLTENTKMTPLYRAAYNGNLQMIEFLVEKYHADINFVTEAGQTALVAAVKRNHLNVVIYLLRHGADVNFVSSIGLTILEYAILPGYYESALMIYQKCKKKEIREAGEYEEMAKDYRCRYVNYSIFVENLKKKIEPENMPNFLKRVVKSFKDPVVDPRETWGNWFKRQMEFKDPPLVERDDLPHEMQPQNKRFGKVSHFFHRLTMSRLSQLPTYEPTAKKVMSESGDQDQGNQATHQDIDMRTVS